jgi:hypothetical protein
LDISTLRAAADGAAALATVAGEPKNDVQYYELVGQGKELMKDLSGERDASGALMTQVRGPSGRYVGNLKLKEVAFTGARATSVQLAVATAALRLAIEETKNAIEEVAADVDELRRLAEAAEIGNIAGLYRVLANAREQVDEDGTISQATWDSIAAHEVTAQQGADRARALVRRNLQSLPVEKDGSERADAAERLVREQSLRRSLRLLLLAEQCRLLYRSLKLDQVGQVEPDAVESETRAARRMLEQNATADRELIQELQHAIGRLGHASLVDGVRPFTRKKLAGLVTVLQGDVEQFAAERHQQLESWAPSTAPRVSDAARDLFERAQNGVNAGRNTLARGIEYASRTLRADDPQRDKVEHRERR